MCPCKDTGIVKAITVLRRARAGSNPAANDAQAHTDAAISPGRLQANAAVVNRSIGRSVKSSVELLLTRQV